MLRAMQLGVGCAVLFSFHVSGALAATCAIVVPAPKAGYSETQAVAYSGQESGNLIKRVDDVNPPVVVFIHGGWFVSNSANALDAEARSLAYNAHVAVFNIDYHLTVAMTPASANLNPFPTALGDARCALRWTANPGNGSTWGFDSTRLGVIGFSAGANLAAMAVVAAGSNYDDPSCPNASIPFNAKAVVGYYGVYNFTMGTWAPAVTYLAGQSTTSRTAVLASPYYWITATNAPYPPFLLIRGSADTLFPESQQDEFAAALQDAGGSAVTEDVAGMVHGFGAFNVKVYPVITQSACDMVAFFVNNL